MQKWNSHSNLLEGAKSNPHRKRSRHRNLNPFGGNQQYTRRRLPEHGQILLKVPNLPITCLSAVHLFVKHRRIAIITACGCGWIVHEPYSWKLYLQEKVGFWSDFSSFSIIMRANHSFVPILSKTDIIDDRHGDDTIRVKCSSIAFFHDPVKSKSRFFHGAWGNLPKDLKTTSSLVIGIGCRTVSPYDCMPVWLWTTYTSMYTNDDERVLHGTILVSCEGMTVWLLDFWHFRHAGQIRQLRRRVRHDPHGRC